MIGYARGRDICTATALCLLVGLPLDAATADFPPPGQTER